MRSRGWGPHERDERPWKRGPDGVASFSTTCGTQCEDGGLAAREGGREKTGRRQGREGEGQRERNGDRSGRLSISDPVMSITKIKIHGSPGHIMKAMTQSP